jgi:hypothetical protein
VRRREYLRIDVSRKHETSVTAPSFQGLVHASSQGVRGYSHARRWPLPYDCAGARPPLAAGRLARSAGQTAERLLRAHRTPAPEQNGWRSLKSRRSRRVADALLRCCPLPPCAQMEGQFCSRTPPILILAAGHFLNTYLLMDIIQK